MAEDLVTIIFKDGQKAEMLETKFSEEVDPDSVQQAYILRGEKKEFLILNPPQAPPKIYCTLNTALGGGVLEVSPAICKNCGMYVVERTSKRESFPIGCEYSTTSRQTAHYTLEQRKDELRRQAAAEWAKREGKIKR